MGVVEGLRHSGVSRLGLLALILLAYVVYLAGVLLRVGPDRLATDFPAVEVVVATGLLVVGLVFVRWFFRRETAVAPDEAEAEA